MRKIDTQKQGIHSSKWFALNVNVPYAQGTERKLLRVSFKQFCIELKIRNKCLNGDSIMNISSVVQSFQ